MVAEDVVGHFDHVHARKVTTGKKGMKPHSFLLLVSPYRFVQYSFVSPVDVDFIPCMDRFKPITCAGVVSNFWRKKRFDIVGAL